MFNQRKAGLVYSFPTKLIILIILLLNGINAQTASNGFVNRDNITGNELSAHGFAVSSEIDLNNNLYGEFIVLSKQVDGQLKVFEAVDDNAYALRSQFQLNDNIGTDYPLPYLLTLGNVDNDCHLEIIIAYINESGENFIRILDIDYTSFAITEHSASPAPSPGSFPVGIGIITDSNNNGYNEIVVASMDSINNLQAFEWNGNGWSIISELNAEVPLNMTTGDVNNDNIDEIVMTTFTGLKIFSLENGILNESGTILNNFPLSYRYIFWTFNLYDAQLAIGDIDRNGTNEILVSCWWRYNDYSQYALMIFEHTGSNNFNRDATGNAGIYRPGFPLFTMQVGDFDDNESGGEIYFSDNGNTVDYLEFIGTEGNFTSNSFNTPVNIFTTNDIMIREICYLEGHHHYLDDDRFHDFVILTGEDPNGPEVFVIESEIEDISLPVSLTTFSATLKTDHIHIAWTTESETNNSHFTLERSTDNINFTKIAEIDGQGNTNQQTNYYFDDYNLASGNTYYYRLADFDFNGAATFHPEVQTSTPDNLISELKLYQNFPNPFNPETTIRIAVPAPNGEEMSVTIQVFNTSGQVVKTIFNGLLSGGQHQFKWDGKNHCGINSPSGIYITRFIAGNMIKTNKMMLIR